MTDHEKNLKKIKNPKVAAVFKAYPEKVKNKLFFLRQLIIKTASSMEGVGELEETLRWGEPSYITSKTKTGSTIRIDWKESRKEQYEMYFHCTTNLVSAFREKYPAVFKFGGNRSIIFELDDEIPVKELKNCIGLALTYHLNKNLDTAARWEIVKKKSVEPT